MSSVIMDQHVFEYGRTGRSPNATPSPRRAALSLVAPGVDGFDFSTIRPTVAGTAVTAPSVAGRTCPRLSTPAGS